MRLRRVNLLRRFLLVGALAMALFGAAMAALLADFLERRMLARDGEVTREFVQSLVDGALRSPDPGSPGIDGVLLAPLASMPDVVRINLYDPERRVAWSSRPELIGRQFAQNDELEDALRDRVIVHAVHTPSDGAKDEHLLLNARQDPYVEYYVPVTQPSGRVRGVVEIYRRPSALFRAIEAGQRRVWLGALLGGAGLFLALAGFVRHTQRALQDQQRRLIEAEALAMVGELAAGIAHSLRNPLGSIRSTAELVVELEGDPSGNHARIVQDVDRVEREVRALLAVTGEALHPGLGLQRTELDLWCHELLAQWEPVFRRAGHRLEADLEPGLGRARIDAPLLTQAMASLLGNALDALALRRRPGRARLRARRHGQQVVLAVSDNGPGFEAGAPESDFVPLRSGKPGGVGLGLTLARRVALRAGGRFRLSSRPGVGTRVRLLLPVDYPAPT